MTPTSRRRVVALVGMAPIGALAACSTATTTTPTATTPAQFATDVNLTASGLSQALVQIAAIPGVPAATLTQLQGYLTTIQADAKNAAAALTAAPSATVAQEVSASVQALAPIALGLLPGGSPAIPLVEAAVSLLPAILAAAGVAGGPPPGVYTPDQARVILAGAYAQ